MAEPCQVCIELYATFGYAEHFPCSVCDCSVEDEVALMIAIQNTAEYDPWLDEPLTEEELKSTEAADEAVDEW